MADDKSVGKRPVIYQAAQGTFQPVNGKLLCVPTIGLTGGVPPPTDLADAASKLGLIADAKSQKVTCYIFREQTPNEKKLTAALAFLKPHIEGGLHQLVNESCLAVSGAHHDIGCNTSGIHLESSIVEGTSITLNFSVSGTPTPTIRHFVKTLADTKFQEHLKHFFIDHAPLLGGKIKSIQFETPVGELTTAIKLNFQFKS